MIKLSSCQDSSKMDAQKENRLEKSLVDWVASFPGSNDPKIINSSLVNHQTYDIWKHIIRHVKPRHEAWKIKANLEIKNKSVSQRKLQLKESVEGLKKEIAQLERKNAALVQQIHIGQQKIIARDSSLHARKAKQLAFSRDVTFLKIHRSACASRAKEAELLTDSISSLQEIVLPVHGEDGSQSLLTQQVIDLVEDYRRSLVEKASNSLNEKILAIVENHPHSSITEVLRVLAKEGLQEIETYRRSLREGIQKQSPAKHLKTLEDEMYQLSIKIRGLWSLVRDLEENVIPTAIWRRDNLRTELMRTMQDRLLLDEGVCCTYIDAGRELAGKQAILEYLRNEITNGKITKQDTDGIEELCQRTVETDAQLGITGKQLFQILHTISLLSEEIERLKPVVPMMSDLSTPNDLRNSLVKEVEDTLAAFKQLDSREESRRKKFVIKFSLPVFQVLTQKRVLDFLLQQKNFQEFVKSTRLSFEAKRTLFAKQEENVDAVKVTLKKVSAQREQSASLLGPRLKAQVEKTESEKKTLQRCHTAIQNWIHEPGQNAILPHRKVDDLTFQEWKAKTPSL